MDVDNRASGLLTLLLCQSQQPFNGSLVCILNIPLSFPSLDLSVLQPDITGDTKSYFSWLS